MGLYHSLTTIVINIWFGYLEFNDRKAQYRYHHKVKAIVQDAAFVDFQYFVQVNTRRFYSTEGKNLGVAKRLNQDLSRLVNLLTAQVDYSHKLNFQYFAVSIMPGNFIQQGKKSGSSQSVKNCYTL